MIIITNVEKNNYNAGPKAPRDIMYILIKEFNAKTCNIYHPNKSNVFTKTIFAFKIVFKFLNLRFKKDLIIYQHPTIFDKKFLNILPKKRTVMLIHDVRKIRHKEYENDINELNIINSFKYIIVHNAFMEQKLKSIGVKSKMYHLNLFDYLCSKEDEKKIKFEKPIIVYAGNLSLEKSPFLHQLDENKMKFNINAYGVGIDKDISSKIHYKGKALPDDLPNIIEGNIGLVWDGNFDESDEAYDFKNYTKFNNPHKLSCYLAAGLPVIVWNKAATAKMIKEKNIGYTISNLYDINKLNFKDYDVKMANVLKEKSNVRNGYYTKKVINQIIEDIDK